MKTTHIAFAFSATAFALLVGCGVETTSVPTLDDYYSKNMKMYDTFKDLPDCDEDMDGTKAFVTEESVAYICDDGKWRVLTEKEIERDTISKTDTVSTKDTISIRDTVALCGDDEYKTAIQVCQNDEILPICADSLEGQMEKTAKEYNYTCRHGKWVKSSVIELVKGLKCDEEHQGDTTSYQYSNYVCRADSIGWVYDFDNLNRDSLEYGEQVYKTIGIGSQMWFAENLNYADEEAMPNLEGGHRCFGGEASCEKYGSLYTWAAAMNLPKEYNDSLAEDLLKDVHQGVCPDGWHVPNVSDWEELKRFVLANNGGEGVGVSLKAVDTWQDGDAPGNDRFGYNAKGVGMVTAAGVAREQGVFAIYHIATEMDCDENYSDGQACTSALVPVRADFRYSESSLRYLQSTSYKRGDYMSIRCVKTFEE